ncbi:MAG TPA: histidinol-phosphatase [Candidatus Hydrogenedentes bacterium]|nr:histidinol-phosphatase [Candidatus Hydrogenedentota bacterium]
MKRMHWKISLHGGHSSEYCDHAQDPLPALVAAAVDAGISIYGITEHAPRFKTEHMYSEELALGWTPEILLNKFRRYAHELDSLSRIWDSKITLLKGFEAEVIPSDSYADKMLSLKRELGFDYIVGSVHYVNGISIDYTRALFGEAVQRCGSLENLCVAYFQTVRNMAEALRPEVLGHFDLIRKMAGNTSELQSAPVLRAAENALHSIREIGCIIDINTSPLRKGFACPYPAPHFLKMIREKGIPVCFGDDSHSAAEVGAGFETARQYLIDHGIRELSALNKKSGKMEKETVLLQ